MVHSKLGKILGEIPVFCLTVPGCDITVTMDIFLLIYIYFNSTYCTETSTYTTI